MDANVNTSATKYIESVWNKSANSTLVSNVGPAVETVLLRIEPNSRIIISLIVDIYIRRTL